MIDRTSIVVLLDKQSRFYGAFGTYTACADYLDISVCTLKSLLNDPKAFIPDKNGDNVRPMLTTLKNKTLFSKKKGKKL